jgi:hypothetical protein
MYISFAATITAATILSADIGDIVVDIWKTTYGSFPPNVGNSITNPPTGTPSLSGGRKMHDTTLSGWTKNLTPGDVLAFFVMSSSVITNCTVTLTVTRSN